jgi:hypothetical protein
MFGVTASVAQTGSLLFRRLATCVALIGQTAIPFQLIATNRNPSQILGSAVRLPVGDTVRQLPDQSALQLLYHAKQIPGNRLQV